MKTQKYQVSQQVLNRSLAKKKIFRNVTNAKKFVKVCLHYSYLSNVDLPSI